MANEVFGDQIGRNIEVCIDDVILKSRRVANASGHDRNICQDTTGRYKTNTKEMCFHGGSRKVLGIHSVRMRN